MPLRDPTTAVLADPQVPESQRFCAHLRRAGRARPQGQAGPGRGLLPQGPHAVLVRPRLAPGDLVDHRYEILGALAHGGLGWIYLARDRNISESGADRWVVLKGLINTGDADAMAAAVAERRFLVEVDHPNIVKIHDFAQQPDPKTGELVGYIVMEYVGGRSLKDLALAAPARTARARRCRWTRSSPTESRSCRRSGYLHDRGLLFCDFKPDNVIHAEEQLKLIDLGAVRRIDDQASPLWGTPGYQAPELERRAPPSRPTSTPSGARWPCSASTSVASPPGTRPSLPDPGDVALLAQEESYHRLLLRATHTEPLRRVRLRRRLRRAVARRPAGGPRRQRRRTPAGAVGPVHPGADDVRRRGRRGRRPDRGRRACPCP